MTLFEGISAFPITPADALGIVDAEGVRRVVTPLVEAGVDSIGLLGSTGIYAYLDRSERRRAIRAAAAAIKGRTPLIVGVGALRTDEAQDLARDAEAEGADGLLMAPMSYTPLTQDEVFEHYQAVAQTTRLPLCVYNNPSTTHFNFSGELLDRLAATPNIAAVKMPLPTPGTIRAELDLLRPRPLGALKIGYSGDAGFTEALAAGADAFYSVFAGFLPDIALKLAAAIRAGSWNEVSRLDDLLSPLWPLFREFGSLRVAYAAANALCLCDAEPPRPILPLPDDRRRLVAKTLMAARQSAGPAQYR